MIHYPITSKAILLANLCKISYRDNNYVGQMNHKQWRVIDFFNDELTGLYAVALAKGKNIVIAARGTDFTHETDIDKQFKFFQDIQAIGEFILVSSIGQLNQLFTFYNSISSQNPQSKITLTGHSLGGLLVQLLAIKINFEYDSSIPTYSFDSPGVMEAGKNLLGDKIYDELPELSLQIRVYNTAPNFINSFGVQLSDPTYLYTYTKYHGSDFGGFLHFTLDQHNINNVIKALTDWQEISFAIAAPQNVLTAFIFYQNYFDFNIYWKEVAQNLCASNKTYYECK